MKNIILLVLIIFLVAIAGACIYFGITGTSPKDFFESPTSQFKPIDENDDDKSNENDDDKSDGEENIDDYNELLVLGENEGYIVNVMNNSPFLESCNDSSNLEFTVTGIGTVIFGDYEVYRPSGSERWYSKTSTTLEEIKDKFLSIDLANGILTIDMKQHLEKYYESILSLDGGITILYENKFYDYADSSNNCYFLIKVKDSKSGAEKTFKIAFTSIIASCIDGQINNSTLTIGLNKPYNLNFEFYNGLNSVGDDYKNLILELNCFGYVELGTYESNHNTGEGTWVEDSIFLVRVSDMLNELFNVNISGNSISITAKRDLNNYYYDSISAPGGDPVYLNKVKSILDVSFFVTATEPNTQIKRVIFVNVDSSIIINDE